MHADEVDTDVSLVRRLLAAQFPHWADLPIEPVPSAGTKPRRRGQPSLRTWPRRSTGTDTSTWRTTWDRSHRIWSHSIRSPSRRWPLPGLEAARADREEETCRDGRTLRL